MKIRENFYQKFVLRKCLLLKVVTVAVKDEQDIRFLSSSVTTSLTIDFMLTTVDGKISHMARALGPCINFMKN